MGGGSSKKNKAEDKNEYKGATTPQMLSLGGMPQAQQGLLLQQLMQGFGGTMESQAPQIAGMVQPQSVPLVQRPSDVMGLLEQQGIKPGYIYGDNMSKNGNTKSKLGLK